MLRSVLASGHTDFTGLFVVSDASVLGAIKALLQANISLPKQVSIVGYDDIYEAAYLHPSLTTIQQDLTQIAERAVEILDHRLAGENSRAMQYAVAPRLVIRESTCSMR
jgi:LacI family transcriptional regulator